MKPTIRRICAFLILSTFSTPARADEATIDATTFGKFTQCAAVHVWAASWSPALLQDNLLYAGDRWATAAAQLPSQGNRSGVDAAIGAKVAIWTAAVGLDANHQAILSQLQGERRWIYDHFQSWFIGCKALGAQHNVAYQPFE